MEVAEVKKEQKEEDVLLEEKAKKKEVEEKQEEPAIIVTKQKWQYKFNLNSNKLDPNIISISKDQKTTEPFSSDTDWDTQIETFFNTNPESFISNILKLSNRNWYQDYFQALSVALLYAFYYRK